MLTFSQVYILLDNQTRLFLIELFNTLKIRRSKVKKFNFILIMALVSWLSATAFADVVPTQMNFQGVLTDTGGNPISDSSKSVYFTIYDAAFGGNILWAETLNVTTDNQGRFTVILGRQVPISGAIFSDTSRYLGVTVGTDPEISPRAKISSAAYSLRTNTISSTEILDEPGIAWNNYAPLIYVALNDSEMVDLVTVSITTPASGYVVVEGMCTAILTGTTSSNYAHFQIDVSPGWTVNCCSFASVGMDSFSSTSFSAFPVSVTNIYYYAQAGTHAFRLEGMSENGIGGTADALVRNSTITAIYYPSSYGQVLTAVSSSEASQFENATPIPRAETSGGVANSSEQVYQVDLRELELKALKAQAEAEIARREFLEAQLKLQQDANFKRVQAPQK